MTIYNCMQQDAYSVLDTPPVASTGHMVLMMSEHSTVLMLPGTPCSASKPSSHSSHCFVS